MRLLNTATLQLEDFISDTVPSYAILSHRWGSEEVTFQDMRESKAANMAGYSKITGCCTQAALDGWQYVWVDSCCIDKSSSAELSEAINSMFKWYRKAQVCYAYLSDVRPLAHADSHILKDSEFRHSKWFTRGWTLQELLAPEIVVFFDQNWTRFGTKSMLQEAIQEITGIGQINDFRKASVAQKMSWASQRQTTRMEDQAYCLMGLFGVNMPPLYGEGERAFLRLQLEILKVSDDESIFAWSYLGRNEGKDNGGLLAESPLNFRDCRNVIKSMSWPHMEPYEMTNKGLRFKTILIGDYEESLALLKCFQSNESAYTLLAIRVSRLYKHQFRRYRLLDEGGVSSVACGRDIDGDGRTEGRKRVLIYVKQPNELD